MPIWVWWVPARVVRASVPSVGVMGSRTLRVSERAMPTSDHWPQLMVVAGRPDACRQVARPSSQALAQA